MSKFGDLIDLPVPVLLGFYADWNEEASGMHPVLTDVAATMGDKVKIIKINIDKNPELTDALRIKQIPTLIIYKEGEMVWRTSGIQDAAILVETLEEYVS